MGLSRNRKAMLDFSSGTVGGNPPVSTGDTCSIPGPGRFHRPQSWCVPATEPTCCSYWSPHALASLLHKRRQCTEKPRNHNKQQPPLAATRESPCAAKKTQCQNKQRPQPKINKFKKKKRKKNNVEPPLTVFPSSRSLNSWGFVTGPMSLWRLMLHPPQDSLT